MSPQHKTLLTPEEYPALERKAETKSEYFAGEVFAKVGASKRHNLIASNHDAKETLKINVINCELALKDVYAKVK